GITRQAVMYAFLITYIYPLGFFSTDSVLVSNKHSDAAPVSLEALMKAWNLSLLGICRPRPVFTKEAEWRPLFLLFFMLGRKQSSPRSKLKDVLGLEGLLLGCDHIVPLWTSLQTGHHHGASPKLYPRRRVSSPVTTYRNKAQVVFTRQQ
ncbi:hypothetical protein GOODEAATRI_009633, partial [Goodea atripinnis]